MNRSFPERIKRILIAQSGNKRLDLIHRLHRITIELNSVLHVKAFERNTINGAQTIPRCLYRIESHVGMNKSPPQLRRNCRRHTTATKEIGYEHAKRARPDAVVATGRSDSPNQINNVLSFPYLFRGALDTLSTTINEAMKIAAAKAIAAIAQQPVTKEIEEVYGRTFTFGKEYILPKPGDKRLLTEVSSAVARAAMECGIARRGIASFSEYSHILLKRVENDIFFAREHLRHRIGRHGSEREREY